MTAASEGGEWSAARPGRTLPPGKTRYPFCLRLGGPQDRSGRAENLVPAGIQSRTVQPVVSRYTDWATDMLVTIRKQWFEVTTARLIRLLRLVIVQFLPQVLTTLKELCYPTPWSVGQCNHGVAYPQVADGGDGIQIWRVTANVLNKQLRTTNKGWSSSVGFVEGQTSHAKTLIIYKMYQKASDLEGSFGTT